MPDESMLAGYLSGEAVAVAARERWSLLAPARSVRYLDEIDLAELRRRRPDWRETPLAPISIVTDIWTLAGLPDRSLDCLVCFHLLSDPDRAREGFAAARRVLRAGGILIACVPDERYVRTDADGIEHRAALKRIEASMGLPEAVEGIWTTTRIVRLATSLPPGWSGELEIEAAARIGGEALIIWSKGAPGGLMPGALFRHGERVYALDRRRARHVQTVEALDMLHPRGAGLRELAAPAFARMTMGPPMRAADVDDFLRRHGRR